MRVSTGDCLMVRWMSLWLGVVGAIGLATSSARAQIIPDATLAVGERSRLGTVTVNGQPSAIIDSIVGGAQRGQNLFHSFQEFNVAAGRGVYFQNPDAAVQNILARVTGNNNSTIEGTLGTFGPGRPSLFLINPNGIVFGRNASLDVQASFAATTASAIGFGNTGEFSAINPQQPGALLTVDPSAFIFASLQKPGSIVVQSQARQTVLGDPTLGLKVPNGDSLILLGGDVLVERGEVSSLDGRIEVGASADKGRVELLPNGNLIFSPEILRGDVTLTQQSRLFVSGAIGGEIGVTAKHIEISNSILLGGILPSLGKVENKAGSLNLDSTREVRIIKGSIIENNVNNNSFGNGGDLIIKTGFLEVTDGSQLNAITLGKGNAGSILINASDRVSFIGTSPNGRFSSGARSGVEMNAIGSGGNIEITTGTLQLLNGAALNASINGLGNGGDIIINAREKVSLIDIRKTRLVSNAIFSRVERNAEGKGGNIEIKTHSLDISGGSGLTTTTLGKGNAGNVIINATEHVLFTGTSANEVFASGIRSNVGVKAAGTGGNIEISTNSLDVNNGAQLVAATFGTGDAGNIIIKARDRVSFSGTSINELVASVAGSSVEENALGKGGNIEIFTGSLTIADGAQLRTDTNSLGFAGNIIIKARDRVLFTGTSQNERSGSVAVTSTREQSTGNGGNIEIFANTLAVNGGAQLVARTVGTGNAGNIQISAVNSVDVIGIDRRTGRSSALFTSTFSPEQGTGGDIIINAKTLQLSEGGILDSRTFNSGDSGNIIINAETVDILKGGQILAITEGSGRAGTIALNANDRLTIQGRDVTYNQRLEEFGSTVGPISENSGIFVQSQASGGAGSLFVTTPKLQLDRAGTISAVSSTVDGGNIILNIGKLLTLRNGSQISATAGTANAGGNGGNITINSPDGFLIAIPKENSDITANAFNGSGGKVTITNQGIFGLQFRPQLTELSDITASSQFGFSGTVTINSPDTSFIQNGLNQLPKDAIDTTKLLSQTCIVRKDKPNGTFYITGTDGLPNRPSDLSPSQYPTNTITSTQTATRPWQKGDPIVEPQGFYTLTNGRLVMSRECRLEPPTQP